MYKICINCEEEYYAEPLGKYFDGMCMECTNKQKMAQAILDKELESELQEKNHPLELCYDCDKIIRHCDECKCKFQQEQKNLYRFGQYLSDYICNDMPQNSEDEELARIDMAKAFEYVFGYNPIKGRA